MDSRIRSRCPGPVAFVFSGGSSLGALHAGMLRAVLEAGIQPDFLVGTSAGALNAAFIAKGFTAERVEELAGIWSRLRTNDVFPGLGIWSSLRCAAGVGTLASPSGLKLIIDRHLPATHAELAIPTAVIASDLATGSAVAFREGDPPRRGLAGILYVLTLMLRHQAVGVLPLLLGLKHTVLYLPAPCPLPIAPHDFSQGARLVEMGHAAAKPFLDGGHRGGWGGCGAGLLVTAHALRASGCVCRS